MFDLYNANDYVIKTPAASLPITLSEVKEQARLDPSDTSEDTYLTGLIGAVVNLARSYMKRDIINQTYTLYRDRFPGNICGIQLARGRLQSLTSVKYYADGVLTVFDPSNYYVTASDTFSSIYLISTSAWPTNVDCRKQAIQIEFVAGMGANATAIPDDIKQALKQHVTFIYQSRGDSADGGFNNRIPDIAKAIYAQYKIYTPEI